MLIHTIKNKICVLAIAGMILAVLSIGDAYALTWNDQTDVSQYTSSAQWYFQIGDTGSAYINQPVSWANGFNNNVYGYVFKPNLIWQENVNGQGFVPENQPDNGTIGYLQAWGINENTHNIVTSNGANYLKVWHQYLDSTGSWSYGVTSEQDQYYTIS